MAEIAAPAAARTPCGINHIVLNVHDMDTAHSFWTESLGFRHVATGRAPSDGSKPMRFYSGEVDGKLRHHDIALMERAKLDGDGARTLNHVAIAYPTFDAFQQQIAFLMARGVALHRRIDRGVTQSIHLKDPDGNEIELVHELPREAWEDDIQAALDHAVEQPIGA
jgi:catechol 2,3-dioxygenase